MSERDLCPLTPVAVLLLPVVLLKNHARAAARSRFIAIGPMKVRCARGLISSS